jgi:peptidoglycan/LPS O-acetylase OafA/YrhL
LNGYRFTYTPFLNGLRAFAILTVLSFHGMGGVSTWLFGKGSWTGIDLFFVLSSFLIASLLLQEQEDDGQINVKRFYTRRALRVYPGYFAFILVAIFANPYHQPNLFVPSILTALFVSDYATAFNWSNYILSGMVQTWSISVEEKFYLLSPLLFAFRRRLGLVILGLLAIVEFWKGFLIWQGVPWVRLQAPFDTQVDGILFGCLAAFLLANESTRNWLKSKLSYPVIPFLVAAAVVLANAKIVHPSLLHSKPEQFLFWLFYFPAYKALLAGFIVCLTFHKNSIVTKFLELPFLVWIGTVSYGIYLWHEFAFRLVGTQVIFWLLPYLSGALLEPKNVLLLIEAMKFSFALGFGALSYSYLETPFLKIKARFEPRSRVEKSMPAPPPRFQGRHILVGARRDASGSRATDDSLH